ncbi:MAG: hypothetical protein AB1704_10515 [Pseudomonadota bacterium]|jgi:hypothetical protein|uniref:hypothetical protein n=1 Tax=Burkholderiaceae TaxID=119060 RepID=UPI0010F9D3A4|nr:hypothetical protein [Burkholderia sp. 4M9327F10]
MRFDVATFNSLCLMTFLCSAIVCMALSRIFERVAAFRYWTAAFFLMSAAAACFGLHAVWPTRLLLIATAVLGLQSRILVWSGTRVLFGASVSLRVGFAITALFCVLFALAHKLNAPPLCRAALLTLFFLPCRALTLYEVCRRRRPDLGPARVLVAIASVIASLNAAVPLTLVLMNRGNLSLLLGNPQTTSAVYAVVFAGDLLLIIGLIVLALQYLIVEQGMLANLDREAAQRPAPLNPVLLDDAPEVPGLPDRGAQGPRASLPDLT